MISFPTILDRRLKEAAPPRAAWIEAWGYVLVGIGIYLALACYTFNPYDYAAGGLNSKGVTNLAGPFGAIAAAHILGRFGVVGMVWPAAAMAWGALTVTGFVLVPRARRFLGFVAITCDLAGFVQVLLPRTRLPEPSFGFGGLVGMKLHRSLMPHMGLGGTLTALSVIGLVALVLTGNIKLLKTAELTQEGIYLIRRTLRKLWAKFDMGRFFFAPAKAGMPSPQGALAATDMPKRRSLQPGETNQDSLQPAEAQKERSLKGFHMELFYDGPAHGRPTPALFTRTRKAPDRSRDFKTLGESLVRQLSEFKIFGDMVQVTEGPVVTTFEFRPAPGTKVSKIAALGEDLARLLKAQSLRVLAPIPGKDTVGFEVPNAERAVIGFQDLMESQDFRSRKIKLPIAMGVDIFGKAVTVDLAEMPHLLVAGSTGSGKSVFMNALIGSLIARHTAESLRFVMIDPKMVEMAAYNGLPHMACPVITDPATEGKAALNELVEEMEDRYRRMRAVGARNIDSFNDTVKSRKKSEFLEFEGRWAPMPYIVLIVDEMADMMMLLGKEAEAPITRLAQKARAAGIHLVIATQRPSADVVTGLIKANFPTRVAFRVLSGIDSRTILDQAGAETLLGKGDMLYLASGGAQRMHGAFLSETEVQAMVKAAKTKTKA